jgi:hypothetical protein
MILLFTNIKRKGVGSIIGGAFILLTFTSIVTFLYMYMSLSFDMSQVQTKSARMDLNRAQENLEVYKTEVTSQGFLNVSVRNTGHITSNIIYIGAINQTSEPEIQEFHQVNIFLSPGESNKNVAGDLINISNGETKHILLATALGNIYHGEYPEVDSGGSGSGNSTGQYHIDYSQVDLHPNSTVGTHSFFAAMKGHPDTLLNNITESVAGAGASSEWLDVNAFDSTYTDWTSNGSSPYLGSQDQPTNYIYTSGATDDEGWFDFPSTTLNGTLSVNITIYGNNDDGAGNDGAEVWVDYTGTGSGTNIGTVAQHTGWQYDTISLGTHTVSEVNNLRVRLRYYKSGPGDDVRIDHIMIGVTTGSTSYELDLEAQFTELPQASNEYLSIYGGVQGAENLQVDVWNGTQYVTLISDVQVGWNHVDVSSYHVGTTFNIRFKDTVQVSDFVQDLWEIDALYLNLWD